MFEFDPEKSLANLVKHGIDFDQAQALWLDDNRLEMPAWSETEMRWGVVGLIGDKFWAAFVTMRDDAIRIILVRCARDYEVKAYVRQES